MVRAASPYSWDARERSCLERKVGRLVLDPVTRSSLPWAIPSRDGHWATELEDPWSTGKKTKLKMQIWEMAGPESVVFKFLTDLGLEITIRNTQKRQPS